MQQPQQFKSKDRSPRSIPILDYVYDQWMPLIGPQPIGIYGLYTRLAWDTQFQYLDKTIDELAQRAGVSKQAIVNANKILEACGFIEIEKPKGQAKLMHASARIHLFNPPSPTPEQIDLYLNQSNKGYIYLLEEPINRWYKIGMSRDANKRIKGLRLPFKVTMLHSFPSDDVAQVEQYLHEKFANKRLHGEWFALTQEDVNWLCSIERYEVKK